MCEFIAKYCVVCCIRCAMLCCHSTCNQQFASAVSDLGGLSECIRLCKKYNHPRMLAAIGQVLVSMVPSPEQLKVRDRATGSEAANLFAFLCLFNYLTNLKS